MKLGFYYHSAFKIKNNKILVPGYIGVFIDELANQTDKLYLFLERQTNDESQEEDYELSCLNIELIDLGSKSSFYKRLLMPQLILKKFNPYKQILDAFLIRCPSPLAPHIFNYYQSYMPVFPLLVGNYIDGLKDLKQPLIRKTAITILTHYYQYLQNKMVSRSNIFVNSALLEKENKSRAQHINLIKTTTLSKDSFFKRQDTCNGDTINLLYTGRINFQKGLRELIQATAILNQKFNVTLNIVGWEEGETNVYQLELEKEAQKFNIKEKVIFHGKKKIGTELQAFYQTSDIYVIPSYHEGFPRTIWEAMASSTPVIATSVGSIPFYLKDKFNALIIRPRDVNEIVNAAEQIITDKQLRMHLINNAFSLVEEITLEKQTKILLDKIYSSINSKK